MPDIARQAPDGNRPGAGDYPRDLTLSMGKVNLIAVPLALFIVLAVCGSFIMLWGPSRLLSGLRQFISMRSIVPAILGGIILHELLHGIGWMVCGRKGWGTIRFGFNARALSPYAHCTERMPASAYRCGAALPAIVLGILPLLTGLASGDGWFAGFGTLFLIAAVGDGVVLWIIRGVPGSALVEDHPTLPGCLVHDAAQP